MNLDEAKQYLGFSYVLHPLYEQRNYPWHSAYARVDVAATCARVRQRQQQSFSNAVEQTKRKLRMVHGKAVNA